VANVLPKRRMNPAAGGGLVADWRPGPPAAGYAGRYVAYRTWLKCTNSRKSGSQTNQTPGAQIVKKIALVISIPVLISAVIYFAIAAVLIIRECKWGQIFILDIAG